MRLRTVAVVACAGSLLVWAAPAGSQRRDAGRVVRLVASAIIEGVAVRTSSAKLAVP
jgi:hypothetical protein